MVNKLGVSFGISILGLVEKLLFQICKEDVTKDSLLIVSDDEVQSFLMQFQNIWEIPMTDCSKDAFKKALDKFLEKVPDESQVKG